MKRGQRYGGKGGERNCAGVHEQASMNMTLSGGPQRGQF